MMQQSQMDKYLFFFCMIDMFFLPYFPLLTVAFSMPVAFLWWFIRRKELSSEKEYKIVLYAILLIALSTVYSFVVYPSNIKDNLVYLLEMSAVFIYYIMFKYYLDNNQVDLEKWLFYFILFVTAFVVIFNIDKSLYQRIKYLWNARMATAWYTDIFAGYRFGFIWMDENNIAYMMNTITFIIIVSKKTGIIKKIISLLSCVLVFISSMSSGGRTSFIVLWGSYFLYRIFTFKGKLRVHKRFRLRTLLGVIVAIVLVLFVVFYFLPSFSSGDIFTESKTRNDENSMDSRLAIWKTVVSSTNWLAHCLFGHGGRTMVNGQPKAPHNGHLYWILGYGMIVYALYMYIFFRKRKTMHTVYWIALIPYFLGFSINTMVGEPKVNEIIALIVAYYSTRTVLEYQT